MKFVARTVAFEGVTEGKVLAFSDRAKAEEPSAYVILSFAEEDEQDRTLGLTGLHIETSEDSGGYGYVEEVRYDGRSVLIVGRGRGDVEIVIDSDTITSEAIRAAVTSCNRANATRPERAA